MWAFRTRNRVESGARPAVANWWVSNREGSVSGALFRSSIDQIGVLNRRPAAQHPTRLIIRRTVCPCHSHHWALEYRAPLIRLPFAAPTSQCFSIPAGREQGAGLAALPLRGKRGPIAGETIESRNWPGTLAPSNGESGSRRTRLITGEVQKHVGAPTEVV
jgi:hypothetical protein